MNRLWALEQKITAKKIPHFKGGDQLRVHVKIKEGDKERVQIFEGTVLKIHNAGARSSFTVRKISYGVGVERIFPMYSPVIQKIDVVTSGKVRRAKLYYLRNLSGRQARIFAEEEGEPHAQAGKERAASGAASASPAA